MNSVNKNSNPEVKVKLAELKKFLPVLLMAPYTRALFLAGSTTTGDPRPESDLDLIIVSQNNRLWLNRFFLEALTRIFKIRRTKNNFKNKICFNISLSSREPVLPHQDAVGARFYKNMKPVWGDRMEIKKFWEKNSWIKNFEELPADSSENLISNKNRAVVKIITEKILDYSGAGLLLEKISYALQARYLRKKFNRAVTDKNSPDFDFNVTPNLIAYHFPVSNHARAKKHGRATVENNSAPEK
ncbi:MAG: nucleotidyltransferase domain-containing protein [Minisyncoccia bacterium]